MFLVASTTRSPAIVGLAALLLLALCPLAGAFVAPKQQALPPRSTMSTAASRDAAGDDEFAAKHDFQLQRQYRTILGIKGTLPSQQHKSWELSPIAVCRNCRKQMKVKLVYADGEEAEEEDMFTLKLPEWDEKYMVPADPAVLEELCGEVVHFKLQYHTISIQREILQGRHPDSVLTRRFLEVWRDNPYDKVPIEGDPKYFDHVLNYVRDGSIVLPAGILKDAFLQDLKSYNISFLEENISGEMDSRVIGAAIETIDKQLDGFRKRIIERDLQNEFDDAKQKLEGAKVAHFILNSYFQTHRLHITIKKEECIPKHIRVITARLSYNDIIRSCNPFLEEFGLRATTCWDEGFTFHVRLEVL